MDERGERTQWRLSGTSLLVRVFPLLLVMATGVSQLFQGRDASVGHAVNLWDLWWVLLVVLGLEVCLFAFRIRTRVLPSGLEVRTFRTRVYPWAELADVSLHAGTGLRMIRLDLVNGRHKYLPVPVLGLTKASNVALREAEESLRQHRLNHEPVPTH